MIDFFDYWNIDFLHFFGDTVVAAVGKVSGASRGPTLPQRIATHTPLQSATLLYSAILTPPTYPHPPPTMSYSTLIRQSNTNTLPCSTFIRWCLHTLLSFTQPTPHYYILLHPTTSYYTLLHPTTSYYILGSHPPPSSLLHLTYFNLHPPPTAVSRVEATVWPRCNPAQYGREYLSHGHFNSPIMSLLSYAPTASTETSCYHIKNHCQWHPYKAGQVYGSKHCLTYAKVEGDFSV